MVNVSATGSTQSHRVRTSLTLSVTRTHFSPSASSSSAPGASTSTSQHPGSGGGEGGGAILQVTGRVTKENPHVKMGAFHTLDIESNRDVRIAKDEWDTISLERVTDACVEGRGAEVGAIVCGEGEGEGVLGMDDDLTIWFTRHGSFVFALGAYDGHPSADRRSRPAQTHRVVFPTR